MDLVALVTLCLVSFDPGLMHALAIVESGCQLWSFHGADGAHQSFATPAEAVIAARLLQTDLASIRVGLVGLPTDLLGATA